MPLVSVWGFQSQSHSLFPIHPRGLCSNTLPTKGEDDAGRSSVLGQGHPRIRLQWWTYTQMMYSWGALPSSHILADSDAAWALWGGGGAAGHLSVTTETTGQRQLRVPRWGAAAPRQHSGVRPTGCRGQYWLWPLRTSRIFFL